MKGLLLLIMLSSATSFGSGYEKGILWGAKYAGTAGIGNASVKGSDSIFYNPAGLVGSSEFGEFAFNLSQLASTVKGPVVPNLAPGPSTTAVFTNAERQESSPNPAAWVPGVTYSMKLSDSFAFGLGYYAVGGTRAKYEDIDFAPRSLKAKVGSELTITEFAAGMGYKVTDALRLGLSLRYSMSQAAFSAMSYKLIAANTYGITNLDIKDLKDNKLDSVRLGAQYDLSESVKLGLTIRTETKLAASGKASGTFTGPSAGTSAVIPEVDAKVETVLPLAMGLGTEIKFSEDWKMFGEYVFTQYSKIDKVVVTGDVTVSTGAFTTTSDISDIEQHWKDQHQIKLAGEYAGISWPIRFGYIWTSQVTNSDYARASFTPPGAASTYTLGTGHDFGPNLGLDLAIDYTTVSGTSSESANDPLISPKGSYEATALGIHSGLNYRF